MPRPPGHTLPFQGYVALRLRQNFCQQVAGDVGEAVAAAVVHVGQALVVDAEEVEHRGVEVMDRDGIDGGAVADFVGFAI